jgi:hypothetical protein
MPLQAQHTPGLALLHEGCNSALRLSWSSVQQQHAACCALLLLYLFAVAAGGMQENSDYAHADSAVYGTHTLWCVIAFAVVTGQQLL